MARLLKGLAAREARSIFALSIDRALDPAMDAKATIAAQFAPLADWSRTHEAPVILNEFGRPAVQGGAAGARWNGLRGVRRGGASEWLWLAHWDYNQGFWACSTKAGRPDAALIDVLLPDMKLVEKDAR